MECSFPQASGELSIFCIRSWLAYFWKKRWAVPLQNYMNKKNQGRLYWLIIWQLYCYISCSMLHNGSAFLLRYKSMEQWFSQVAQTIDILRDSIAVYTNCNYRHFISYTFFCTCHMRWMVNNDICNLFSWCWKTAFFVCFSKILHEMEHVLLVVALRNAKIWVDFNIWNNNVIVVSL